MSTTPPHLKTPEEIERTCVPGLVEVLRTEGIDGVRYALWDVTGWHRDYDPCVWRSRADEERRRIFSSNSVPEKSAAPPASNRESRGVMSLRKGYIFGKVGD